MITNVYSIFDVKAKVFGSPFYAQCDEIAIRNCAAAVRDDGQNSMLSKFPEDFTLYRIGSFDDDRGVLSPAGTNEVVVLLVTLKGGV